MKRKLDFEKTKTITLKILEFIDEFYSEIIHPMTLSGMRQELYSSYPRKQIHNNFRTLASRGYIKINSKSDSVVLTNKGKIKLIENNTDVVVDGKWRMLSWDIPETMKSKRQQFCRSIKRIGYRQVQKSLWACPYVHADEVDLVIKEFGISKYVAYLLVEKTDIRDHLKTLFKIKM